MRYSRALAFSLATVLLSGCMVGPKYTKPVVPAPPAYKEQPPESYKESGGWKTAQPADASLKGKWWEIFQDSQLNVLEEQVSTANQDLKTAEARFRQARAQIRYNRASLYPTVTVVPSLSNERYSYNRPYVSKAGATNGVGDFVLPFDFSYEADLWGRIRRSVTAAREQAQASAADLETVRLSLNAELAMYYFELRSADAQKKLLDDTVKAYTDALQLTKNRFEGGVAAKSDVAQAQTQLDTARVQDTDVGVARAQYEHAIAVLIGEAPAVFHLDPAPLATQPPMIPIGLPSELLERRPDIAAAERRVAAANEQIGIAKAAFFPSLVLNATVGLEGSSITNWFNWPSRLWAVGPQLSQTLFDAGRRRSVSEAATAGYDGTVATYRQTTLNAFQEVEDSLSALRILEQEYQQQQQATASAEESLQLFRNRYEGGVDTYLQVITAQTAALQNERNSIDIMRRRMDASVSLVKALGGGWNSSALPKL